MSIKLTTINDIHPFLAQELLHLYNDEEIRSLARIIIKTIFKSSWLHRLTDPGSPLHSPEISEITRICRELGTGKPYQYILGETEFYNCVIKVNESVLIPRPETEELVDLIIRENNEFRGRIIDFGTGSGCIAIALASSLPGSKVTAIDISQSAIDTAETNAALNNVDVRFIKSDIFTFRTEAMADIIVSNPPYVRQSEKTSMKRNVLEFEPHEALFVEDSDPLVFYKAIISLTKDILVKGGKIYFEINEAMGSPVSDLVASSGFAGVTVIRDINDKDRIVKGIKNE